MIRVFARKTNFTPTDDLAFYDEPPMFDLPDLPINVSVTFTWDIERGLKLARSWRKKSPYVFIGGPAMDVARPCSFMPGRFLKEGITITSRGCPKQCPWCLVPGREGALRETIIRPGYIVQDNNILACSDEHFERVCNMLDNQSKGAEFKGGLDIDYLRPWHVEQLKKIRVKELWIACDTEAALVKLDKAADLLSDFPIEKKRCYVLIGYGKDTIPQAERRLETVYEKGFLPFAQLYKPPDNPDYCMEWKQLARKWSRPAVYRSNKK